jgi:diguanylate cyclase
MITSSPSKPLHRLEHRSDHSFGGHIAGLAADYLARFTRDGRHEEALAELERRHALLQEANAHLVLAAIAAQELQSASEEARRQQAEFLAVLAHELRNPLAPIRTAAALLARLPQQELPRLQAVIERQVAHLSKLVGDLLDVSRVNTGKLRFDFGWVNLVEIIDHAVDACQPAVDTRLQHLGVQLPTHALRVRGDPVRLTQVVSNLLDNASKYTPDGGSIVLCVIVDGDAIVMTVSDSGIGIAAKALLHVFEPFVQEPRAIGFNGVGLGIGLAVVREVVEGHGGTVVARSAGTGCGSQFVVTLPAACVLQQTDAEESAR